MLFVGLLVVDCDGCCVLFVVCRLLFDVFVFGMCCLLCVA